MIKLVLASSSPRRADLLLQLGLSFSIVKPHVNEILNPLESATDFIERIAREKNSEIRNKLDDDQVILSADTVVLCEGKVLGKPKSKEDGLGMLKILSGRTHKVLTGVVLTKKSHEKFFSVETKVKFRGLSDDEIEAYWMTGEPKDKAGSYGIQGKGAVFVSAIEGSYSNVVGLPLMETADGLKQLGIDCFT